MRKSIVVLLLCLALAGCASRTSQNTNDLVSIQLLDRNGFSETISARDRLGPYEKADFLSPQPYKKVVRIYGKASQGKTASKISTYHPNGQPWQYLEIENGRAHGKFLEWHPNGQNKIDAFVIEGTPDMSEMAQLTWFFDKISLVYDEKGQKIAEIPYDKGLLEGVAHYFHPNGALAREVPYSKDLIHGVVRAYNEMGSCIEKISYNQGEKEGKAFAYWTPSQLKYLETYENGKLMQAEYWTIDGRKIASIENGVGEQALFQEGLLDSLVEYHQGLAEGAVKNFDRAGRLISLYHIKDRMKNGDEWEYYPSDQPEPCPKLHLQWINDSIQGTCKTWYDNGILESQREMRDSKKHGLCFAWFKEGDLMLMEEYEEDQLIKGAYYKKWEKKPISKIENGTGIATLFDKDGKFLKKVAYEQGVPQRES